MRYPFVRSAKYSLVVQDVIAQICNPQRVYFSAIDYTNPLEQVYFGHQDKKPVYPASLAKLFVAASLLELVQRGFISLEQRLVVGEHNAVDKVKEIKTDPRALLKGGDEPTVGYLLDLMITRSDNTAANVLIDLVTRPRINAMMSRRGWKMSEVTRKFLPRKLEDPAYRDAPMTVATTRHLAELLYRLVYGQVGSLYWSLWFQRLLARQLDRTKIRRGLPPQVDFFHKTGWNEGAPVVSVTGDAGIVHFNGAGRCVVACIVAMPPQEGEEVLYEIGRRLEPMLASCRRQIR